jgi:cytoskeletal protein CcmA (bactofilin family)
VQQQDNMVYFNKSLTQTISHNYFSVSDASNTSLLVSTGSPYSASATRDLLYDGTTFDVLAHMAVDGTSSLQDVNVLGKLDVDGTTSTQDINVLGKLDVSGTTSTQDVNVLGKLDVSGTTSTQDVNVLGKLDVSGTTSAQDINVLGKLDVSGTTSAQDVNVLGKLDVDGNTDLSGNLAIAGNVTANGTILAQQFLPGQVINVSMLGSDDIPQGDVNAAGNTTTSLFSYSYTPKNTTSYLLIEYQSKFDIDDSDIDDSAQAGIFVEGAQISYTYQNFHPTDGFRTSIMFPIVGRYTNSSTAAKSIQVKISSLCDDVITVKGDTSTWLKITEIAR